MTSITPQLLRLAAAARPVNDGDWGSERQIAAQNAFFDAVGPLGDGFDAFCLKATVDEMIDEALRVVGGPQ
jgi:hypothetical protein